MKTLLLLAACLFVTVSAALAQGIGNENPCPDGGSWVWDASWVCYGPYANGFVCIQDGHCELLPMIDDSVSLKLTGAPKVGREPYVSPADRPKPIFSGKGK